MCYGPNLVKISYHLLDLIEKMPIISGIRTQLPDSLLGVKEIKEQHIKIITPQIEVNSYHGYFNTSRFGIVLRTSIISRPQGRYCC